MTVATDLMEELVPQVEELTLRYVAECIEKKTMPDVVWEGMYPKLIDYKLFGLFKKTRHVMTWTKLAGWYVPNITEKRWVLEDGGYCLHARYQRFSWGGRPTSQYDKLAYEFFDQVTPADLKVLIHAFEIHFNE